MSLPASLVSLTSLTNPNPVVCIWGPKAETVLYPPNQFPFPPVDIAIDYISQLPQLLGVVM